jgi:hypothetical protein
MKHQESRIKSTGSLSLLRKDEKHCHHGVWGETLSESDERRKRIGKASDAPCEAWKYPWGDLTLPKGFGTFAIKSTENCVCYEISS